MADCNTLQAEYDALIAAEPQDEAAIAAKLQQLIDNNCDVPSGSGGHGGHLPGGG